MAMVAQKWTLSGLATELGKDRRAVGNALSGVEPDGKSGRSDAWLMKTAIAAIYNKDGEDLDLTEERARHSKEQADKLEMENAVRRGELLERGVVDAAVIGAFARVRAKLLGLPPKLAPVVVQDMDVAEAEHAIRSGVNEALKELSETNVTTLESDNSDVVEGANSTS